MPTSAPKPCTVCGVLVRTGSSRCDEHQVRQGTFADVRRGSRHERGYGNAWTHLRQRILRRDGGLCQVCKAQGILAAGHEVDHIVPKAQGGTDDDRNLQTICVPHHRAKTASEAQAGKPAGGWGGPIAGAAGPGTGMAAKFLRARVSDRGGV